MPLAFGCNNQSTNPDHVPLDRPQTPSYKKGQSPSELATIKIIDQKIEQKEVLWGNKKVMHPYSIITIKNIGNSAVDSVEVELGGHVVGGHRDIKGNFVREFRLTKAFYNKRINSGASVTISTNLFMKFEPYIPESIQSSITYVRFVN